MFREMRRFKQQVSDDECKKILTEENRGTFSVIGDNGYPYTIPINFYYDETDHKIYFHGAKEGHWEWNVTSVVVFGRVALVTDRTVIEDRLRKLAIKYYPTEDEVEEEMSSSSADRVQLYAIEIEHMTGKLVNEK